MIFGGHGGFGGSGGGIYGGNALIINCTFTSNGTGGGGDGGYGQGVSGSGGYGGDGGGVCVSSNLTLSGCTILGNRTGSGGRSGVSNFGSIPPGGNGGVGGGICAGGLLLLTGGGLLLTNCTIAGNFCGAGGGPTLIGKGGNGGSGGGIYSYSTNEVIVACTVASNSNGTNGIGGGICSAVVGGPVLLNDIVALNIGDSPDVAGTFQSLGHNLIGVTDGSSGFSAPGDLVGSTNSPLDPKLGPLADNGGPTLTMALLTGSPAIDAGSAVGAPATDQRGVPRPQGSCVDIGAFECLVSPIFMGETIQSAINCQMQLSGMTPNPTLTLQISTNLLNWWDATNFTAGANGVFQCVDPIPGDARLRFYRLKSGTP